jgi:hypothetical protein
VVICLCGKENILNKNNYRTGKNKHMNISGRIIIEIDLSYGKNFKEIAREIGKDPSTVSYEIRRFVEWNGGECAKELLCSFF